MPRGVRPNGAQGDAARTSPRRETRARPSLSASTLTPASTAPSSAPGSTSSHVPNDKGKAKAEPERRVLPARLRRSAGGGAEGIRDLEEMVVDWLERYGDTTTSPPETLQITISSLPSSLLSTFIVGPEPEIVKPEPEHQAGPSGPSRIETPSWVLVQPGEDDAAEAREEMAAHLMSPSKRLRRGIVGDEMEDTSDAYYLSQHRKFEVFERRQRIREREKLTFERYKMRSRVDLLRNLPALQWGTVVGAILARSDSGQWDRGREKLAVEGVDWLRRRLIREGKDVLRRYDQLLPVEKRKQDGHSSPSIASSMSPPPSMPKPQVATGSDRRGPSRLQPVKPSPPSPKRSRRAGNAASTPIIVLDSDSDSSLSEPTPPPKPRAKQKTETQDQVSSRTRSLAPAPTGMPKLTLKLSPAPSSSPGEKPRFILSSSSTPCLLEAARKREDQQETTDSKKTRQRGSSRSARANAAPFGVPAPPSLESRNEFSLSDEEEFWPIIAAREAHKVELRRQGSSNAPVSREDVLDMEGVEEAVVL